MIGKFKFETPKNNWVHYFICLRSKAYSFKCKSDDESKNKLEGISKSQTKHNKFEEFKASLDGEEYQKESDNYKSHSINHELFHQNVKKMTSSIFDDKRNYLNNKESLTWN